MIGQLTNLNWVSILAAFAAYSVIGALWFTVLFTKPYKASLGRENETLPNKPIFIIGPMICTLVIIIASALLMHALEIESFGAAVEFSLVIGVGFLVANTVNIAINPNIPRPILYGIISGAYHLVCILTGCIILVALN